MSAQTYPRSPKALLGGIAHLGRFIDKIRLRHAGAIQDYNYITVGFDKYLVDFLQIDLKSFEQRVLASGTDEDLLAWVKANSRKPSDQEISEWSQGLLSSGPKDDAARQRQAELDVVAAAPKLSSIPPPPPHLLQFAQLAGAFLTERFARLPMDSRVKNFLAGPSRFGWQIKGKLVWLGAKSYLFRCFFASYVSEHNEGATVGITDDFICQESSGWSGLGAIDILAGALDVSADDRKTLRTWYERHAAFYRVVSRQDRGEETEFLVVRNLVNGQPYTIRVDMPRCPFQPGGVVFGSLTPWRGEWYWSGEQRTYQHVPEHQETGLRREMLERQSGIAYRYCPVEAAQAREANRKQHDEFVVHCGGDLAVYPDGLALAAAEQKRMEALWRAADLEHVRRVMRERGLEKPRPPMRFPREVLDRKSSPKRARRKICGGQPSGAACEGK